eukprot:scaffold1054_cov116-Isochrysis_galbana.AAC.26
MLVLGWADRGGRQRPRTNSNSSLFRITTDKTDKTHGQNDEDGNGVQTCQPTTANDKHWRGSMLERLAKASTRTIHAYTWR